MVTLFNKWLAISLFSAYYLALTGFVPGEKHLVAGYPTPAPHPLHVSVTEINHNSTDKTLEISCKLFTDDFEKVLTQNYKTKVDLINPPDRAAMAKLVDDYIHKHLSLKVDGKVVSFSSLGFEHDQDAVYGFLQVNNITAVKKLELTNTLMFDLFTDQINLMHITVAGNRKSQKLDYPDKEAVFGF